MTDVRATSGHGRATAGNSGRVRRLDLELWGRGGQFNRRQAVVDAAPGRGLVELASPHHVPVTRPGPAKLTSVVPELLADGARQT